MTQIMEASNSKMDDSEPMSTASSSHDTANSSSNPDAKDSSASTSTNSTANADPPRMFSLKKWNAVAMWSWDVECDTCAICRVQVMDACLRCQAESKIGDARGGKDCVVVWGECNHSFHQCCMSLWIKQNNRCPLCQQEWTVQKLGK